MIYYNYYLYNYYIQDYFWNNWLNVISLCHWRSSDSKNGVRKKAHKVLGLGLGLGLD